MRDLSDTMVWINSTMGHGWKSFFFVAVDCIIDSVVPDNQSTCSSKFSLEPLLGKFALASRVEGKASLGVDATEESLIEKPSCSF